MMNLKSFMNSLHSYLSENHHIQIRYFSNKYNLEIIHPKKPKRLSIIPLSIWEYDNSQVSYIRTQVISNSGKAQWPNGAKGVSKLAVIIREFLQT